MNNTAKNLAKTGVITACLCVLAPISVPIGAIPVSLATFVIYLAACIFDVKTSTFAVAAYILLGVCGLPVFSGYRGGAGVIFGATGGYIIGYIPLAVIVSLFKEIKNGGCLQSFSGIVVGTAVLYALGTVWYCFVSGTAFIPALSACVIPFLPFDAVKAVIAVLISRPVSKAIIKTENK